MGAAAQEPAICRLVVLATAVRPPGERRRPLRFFPNGLNYRSEAEAIRRFALIPRQPRPVDWLVDHIARQSIKATTRADGSPGWAWKFDWRIFGWDSDRWLGDDLAKVTVPVAFVHGALSKVVSLKAAAATAALVRSSTPMTVSWVADAHHHLMLDQPLAFAETLDAISG